MEVKSTDLDAIFNGAGTVLTTTQNVTNAIASGINEVRGLMDNSRRSYQAPPQQQYQPVTYGYGYGENNYNGYPGYQGMSYNGYPNNGNMNVGYPGFTNPGYGNMGGYPQNNGGGFTSGPQGGAWY